MRGYGVLDFMVRTYRNNRNLLKQKKSLKTIYQENNLYYVKRKIAVKTASYDPEKKQRFLDKLHYRQKRARQRQALLLLSLLVTVCILIFWLA